MRAHYRNVIQDTAGNISPGAQVAVYTPGTTTIIPATLYSDGSSGNTLPNPFTSPDGSISFYLLEPQRVDLGITPVGGSQLLFHDLDVEVAAQAGGVAVFSGNGSTTVFTIAHGLAATPTAWSVDAASSAAAGSFYTTASSTLLTVTFLSAPASGSSNVSLAWTAQP